MVVSHVLFTLPLHFPQNRIEPMDEKVPIYEQYENIRFERGSVNLFFPIRPFFILLEAGHPIPETVPVTK